MIYRVTNEGGEILAEFQNYQEAKDFAKKHGNASHIVRVMTQFSAADIVWQR